MFRPKLIYFWRAFNLGLDLQITNTLPRRRTTLQSRARVLADFNDDRTFIIYRSNSKCVDYTDIRLNCKSIIRLDRIILGLCDTLTMTSEYIYHWIQVDYRDGCG